MEIIRKKSCKSQDAKLADRSGKSTPAIEKSEILIDVLLQEQESLSSCSKAMRLWVYAVIDGNINLSRQSRDKMLTEAIENLPNYLLEVLLAGD